MKSIFGDYIKGNRDLGVGIREKPFKSESLTKNITKFEALLYRMDKRYKKVLEDLGMLLEFSNGWLFFSLAVGWIRRCLP